MSGIPHNEIMDDLKVLDEEPITEAKEVKSKKKKKDRK